MHRTSVAILAALVCGCASSGPVEYCARTPFGLLAVSPTQTVAPEPGKAAVVFLQYWITDLCPASGKFDRDFPFSVYHVNGDDQELIGFFDIGGKLAYQAKPGRHLFMVNGVENVDFLEANVEAGKTYYGYVTSYKIGVNSRPKMVAIRRDASSPSDTQDGHPCNLQESWVQRQIEDTKFVEKTPKALDWYQANKAKLDDKRRTTQPRWEEAAAQGKKDLQTLHPDDGIP